MLEELKEERNKLFVKLVNIETFRKSEKPVSLLQRELLAVQHSAMKTYFDVLKERIEDLEK